MKLLGNSLIYSAVSLLQKALGFFLLPVYTTFLTAADYGIVNVVTAAVNFLSILYLLSLHGAGTRFEYKYQSDPQAVREIWGTLFIFLCANSAILTAICLIFGERLAAFLGGVPFRPYLLLGLISTALNAPYVLFQSSLQAKQLGARYGLNNLCFFLVNLGLTLLFLLSQGMKADGVLLALALTNAAFFLYTLIAFVPRISLRFRSDRLQESLVYSLPLLPHSLAGWATGLADRIFLSHFRDTAEVGIYSIGAQFGNLINILTWSVNQAFVPWFFEKFEQGELGKKKIARVSEALILGYSVCALAVSLFSPEVLSLMVSPEFRAGWKVIPPLAFSFVFGGVYYIYVNPLFINRTPYVPIITLGSAAVGVALNFALTPRFGMIGASYSSLASMAASSVIAMLLANRLEPIGYDGARIFAFTLVPLGLSLAVFASSAFHPGLFFFLKAALLAAVGCCGFLLYRAETKRIFRVATAKFQRKTAAPKT